MRTIITILLLFTCALSSASELERKVFRVSVEDLGSYILLYKNNDTYSFLVGLSGSYDRITDDADKSTDVSNLFYKLGIRRYSGTVSNIHDFYQLELSSGDTYIDGKKVEYSVLSTKLQYGLELMIVDSVSIEGLLGVRITYIDRSSSKTSAVSLPSVGLGIGYYFD